jgi:hypothetical protein
MIHLKVRHNIEKRNMGTGKGMNLHDDVQIEQ